VTAAAGGTALIVAGCGGSSSPDLGTGPVRASGPGASTSGPGAPTSGGAPTEQPPASGATQPSGRSGHSAEGGTRHHVFAQRAGIPDRRFTDAAASLEIDDQGGDGRTVRLREASLTRADGFVAIFTKGGTLLGSAPVSRTAAPATVRLATRVPRSGELVGVLFVDNGDGHFAVGSDPAVNDGDSDPEHRLDMEDEDFDYTLR
jgi:hypothetical protein